MSVYVITGVSKGIGVSLPYAVLRIAYAQASVVRVRQADLGGPEEPSRRSGPRQGYDREEGGGRAGRPFQCPHPPCRPHQLR